MIRASEHFNLYRVETTGTETSGTSASLGFANQLGDAFRLIALSEVGLSPGDRVSARAKIKNDVSGENTLLSLIFSDAAGATISSVSGAAANNTAFAETVLADNVIPALTRAMRLDVVRQSGSGTVRIKEAQINGGALSAPYSLPVRAADGFALNCLQRAASWKTEHADVAGSSPFSGDVQISRFFDRRRLEVDWVRAKGDDLRFLEADLAILAGGEKTFSLCLARHFWGSPGAAGGALLRLVAGAAQLGKTLNITGANTGAVIGRRGDYVSLQLTSSLAGPYAMFELVGDVLDGSGTIALALAAPVRHATVNLAHVRFSQAIMTAAPTGGRGVSWANGPHGQAERSLFEQRFKVAA